MSHSRQSSSDEKSPSSVESTTTARQPSGFCFPQSISLESAAETFARATRMLPYVPLESPDEGLKGTDCWFLMKQRDVFPRAILQHTVGGPPPEERVEFDYTLRDFEPTNYGESLIQHYPTMENRRSRFFDVSLPSPTTVTRILVVKEHCEKAEALYEKRMLEAYRRVQDTIPAQQLCIEWQIQMEVAMLEHDAGRLNDASVEPYFSPVKAKILERCTRLAIAVDPDVQLAFQLGLGDVSQKLHVAQPKDLSLMVDLANDIVQKVTPIHPVNFVSMLAPTDRTDVQYFKPLEKLKLNGARLCLQLLFQGGSDTAVKRTAVAPMVRTDAFGEGRALVPDDYPGWTPPEEAEDIYHMLEYDIVEISEAAGL